MTLGLTAVLVMAAITMGLRLMGFVAARTLSRWPRAEQAVIASGPCLIASYLAVQIITEPTLILPLCAAALVVWWTNGMLLGLVVGWIAFITMMTF